MFEIVIGKESSKNIHNLVSQFFDKISVNFLFAPNLSIEEKKEIIKSLSNAAGQEWGCNIFVARVIQNIYFEILDDQNQEELDQLIIKHYDRFESLYDQEESLDQMQLVMVRSIKCEYMSNRQIIALKNENRKLKDLLDKFKESGEVTPRQDKKRAADFIEEENPSKKLKHQIEEAEQDVINLKTIIRELRSGESTIEQYSHNHLNLLHRLACNKGDHKEAKQVVYDRIEDVQELLELIHSQNPLQLSALLKEVDDVPEEEVSDVPYTPMHLAIVNKKVDLFKVFTKYGDINQRNYFGDTLLSTAIYHYVKEAINDLLEKDAKVDDNEGVDYTGDLCLESFLEALAEKNNVFSRDDILLLIKLIDKGAEICFAPQELGARLKHSMPEEARGMIEQLESKEINAKLEPYLRPELKKILEDILSFFDMEQTHMESLEPTSQENLHGLVGEGLSNID